MSTVEQQAEALISFLTHGNSIEVGIVNAAGCSEIVCELEDHGLVRRAAYHDGRDQVWELTNDGIVAAYALMEVAA